MTRFRLNIMLALLILVLPIQAQAWPLFGDYQLDWGLGTDQINGADMPIDDSLWVNLDPAGTPSYIQGVFDWIDTNWPGVYSFYGAGDSGTSEITDGETLTVAGGTGLTSAMVADTITVDLDNTAVTPGSYTLASITVDQQGRLTAASSGSAPCEWTETGGVLSQTTASDVVAIESTATTGSTLSVTRDLASGSTDSPVVSIIQTNVGDDQNSLQVTNACSGFAIYGLSTAVGTEAIKGANVASGGSGVTGLGEHYGVIGFQTGDDNDDYGGNFNRTYLGPWADGAESSDNPLAAAPPAGRARLISDADGHWHGITDGGVVYDMGIKPQSWALMRDSGGTDIALVNYKSQAHATYGGAAGGTASHTAVYDFANNETDSDYTVLAALCKVTVIMADPWIGTWDNSTQMAFWTPFGNTADQVTVTARIKRSGSTAADAYTGVRIVLSDETGAHSTSTTALVSAIGTSWEDLTVGPIDVSAYDGELEWALELVTASVPLVSVNATSTLHVHEITVSKV